MPPLLRAMYCASSRPVSRISISQLPLHLPRLTSIPSARALLPRTLNPRFYSSNAGMLPPLSFPLLCLPPKRSPARSLPHYQPIHTPSALPPPPGRLPHGPRPPPRQQRLPPLRLPRAALPSRPRCAPLPRQHPNALYPARPRLRIHQPSPNHPPARALPAAEPRLHRVAPARAYPRRDARAQPHGRDAARRRAHRRTAAGVHRGGGQEPGVSVLLGERAGRQGRGVRAWRLVGDDTG